MNRSELADRDVQVRGTGVRSRTAEAARISGRRRYFASFPCTYGGFRTFLDPRHSVREDGQGEEVPAMLRGV